MELLNKFIFSFIVFAGILIIGNTGTLNIFAEETGEVFLEIKTSKPQFLSNEIPISIMIIMTNNANSTMKVTDISISSRYFELDEGYEKPEIAFKSSQSVNINLENKTKISEGNYSSSLTIDYTKEGNTFTITKIFDVVIVDKKPLIQNIPYTSILLLLAIFYIPAQMVERAIAMLRPITHKVVDALDGNKKPHLAKIRIDEFTKRRDQLIKKLKESIDEIKKDTLITKISEKEISIDHSSSTEVQRNQSTKVMIKILNSELKNANYVVALHAVNKEIINMSFAILISFLPGFILAWFNIGLLNILGFQDVFVWDGVINTLFIGSGTKPIHDIIKAIKDSRS